MDMKNDQFCWGAGVGSVETMNTSTEASTTGQTAQILDFAAYRLRRLSRVRVQSGAQQRRFLWGWPAAGQMSVLSFPAASSFRSQVALRSPQSPGG